MVKKLRPQNGYLFKSDHNCRFSVFVEIWHREAQKMSCYTKFLHSCVTYVYRSYSEIRFWLNAKNMKHMKTRFMVSIFQFVYFISKLFIG